MKPSVSWPRRALALTLTLAATAATLSAPASAAPEPDKSGFTYGCMQSLEVCREAGVKAGSSPESVQKYLESARDMQIQTGYGYTSSPGTGTNRYYAWGLSRSSPGLRLNYYHCQVVNGQLVNCVLQGPVYIQARFSFNGHLVTNIRGTFVNGTPLNLEIAQGVICRPPSVQCTSEAQFGRSPLGPNGSVTFPFQPQYLPGPETYDMAFAWLIYDVQLRTQTVTQAFDSINFWCEQWISSANPGECFFTGAQG